MSRIINNSRKQQRSVTVTLIDLENAFGEVNHSLFHSLIHSLFQSVLRYHHIPDLLKTREYTYKNKNDAIN